jgi:hypothetical protein
MTCAERIGCVMVSLAGPGQAVPEFHGRLGRPGANNY